MLKLPDKSLPDVCLGEGDDEAIDPGDVARVVAAEFAQENSRLNLSDNRLYTLLEVPVHELLGVVVPMELERGERFMEIRARDFDSALRDVLVGGRVVVPHLTLGDTFLLRESVVVG